MSEASVEEALVKVGHISLEVIRRGHGRPIVCLHGMRGPIGNLPFASAFARNGELIAPSHPGFGRSPLPDWMDSVDDLSYVYLDMLEALDLRDVVLVGICMGGWIAAEMAVRSTSRISRLVLAGAVGIKFNGREVRDIPDIFALHPDEVTGLMWHNPSAAPAAANSSEAELEQIARHQEMSALFLWEPYMHNPKLRRRLARIDVPTLVLRGAHDGLVSAPYAQSYADAIPGATLATIPAAGHMVEVEQPHALADRIVSFISAEPPVATPAR